MAAIESINLDSNKATWAGKKAMRDVAESRRFVVSLFWPWPHMVEIIRIAPPAPAIPLNKCHFWRTERSETAPTAIAAVLRMY